MKASEAGDHFVRHIAANIRYWREQTRDLHRRDASELEPERRNLFRAVQFGLEFPQTCLETSELILQSQYFIERRGYWHDWMPFLSQAIARCGDDELRLKCRLLNRLGQAQRLSRLWPEAIASHQEARAIAVEIGDEFLAARADYFLGTVHFHQREYAEAERCGLAALDAFTRLAPGSTFVATTLNELGKVARWQGNFTLAEERYRAALACWQELDDAGDLAATLLNLAETLQAVGRFEEALAYYDETIALLSAAGIERKKALALTNLGALYYQSGDYAAAEKAFRRVDLSYLRRIGDIFYQAMTANGLGNVLLAQGRLRGAEAYLRQSHDLWLQLDDEINLANTIGTLAEALAAQGNTGEALPLYEKACRLLVRYPQHLWARKLLKQFTQAGEHLVRGKEK